MKQSSIVFKLFLATTGLFTITFLLFFIGQSLFLEKFYINKKIQNVQQAFELFVDDYTKSDKSFDSIKKLKHRFFTQTNAQLILLDRNGIIKDENYYYIEIKQAESEQSFYIPLNNVLTGGEYSSFMKLSIQRDEQVVIKGIQKKDVIIPISIRTSHGTWTNNNIVEDLKDHKILLEELTESVSSNHYLASLTGKVSSLNLPSKAELQIVNNIDTLIQGIQQWELSVLIGETRPTALATYTVGDEKKGTNQMFVKPVIQQGEITEFAFAMTSLQPVDEAMLVLKDYYVYAFIIVFFVIILLSFYYSKLIAKPLIKMNEVTRQMADFNFSETLSVSSYDEIGSLSNSINTLSVNLKDRIDQLHIANEKLQKDVEKERQLERTRKDFISGVSHELKTPLSIIRSFTEGIKDGISQNTDHYTDVILEEVDKMNTLIVDMLELAKLESGTYRLELHPFSIHALIYHVYTKLLFSIEEKKLQVHIHIDTDLLVEANQTKLEQVIVNLLSNAIQYTPTGKQIIITAIEEGAHVKVSIKNYGSLIPEESLDKVWDRFYRIDASRSRHTGGTGLGLAIVKNILDLHNTSYGVINEKDGIVFYFFLKKAN